MTARAIASRVALVAASLLAGGVAAEGIARLSDPGVQVVFRESIAFSDDPALGYELRPGARDGAQRISSAGLRDDEMPLDKPAGTLRIAAIGDSLTYGSGEPRGSAYPARLEAELAARARARRVEVLNFGVPGYDITQVVERFRVRALPFAPDLVVYGYTLNDPQAFSIEAEALRSLRDAVGSGGAPESRGPLDRILAHSRVVQMIRRWSLQRRALADLRAHMPDDPAYAAARSGDRAGYFRAIHAGGESRARLERGLDDLAVLANARGLPVLVVIFPLFGREGGGPGVLADVHALVADAAARRGFAVLDLLPVYRSATTALGSEMRIDFLHPDALGHRVAAVAIGDWLCASGWLAAASLDCGAPTDALDAEIEDAIAPSLRPPRS